MSNIHTVSASRKAKRVTQLKSMNGSDIQITKKRVSQVRYGFEGGSNPSTWSCGWGTWSSEKNKQDLVLYCNFPLVVLNSQKFIGNGYPVGGRSSLEIFRGHLQREGSKAHLLKHQFTEMLHSNVTHFFSGFHNSRSKVHHFQENIKNLGFKRDYIM